MIRLSHHLVKRRASRSPVGSPMPSAAKRKTTGWSWPRRRIDFARPVLAARPGRPPRFAGRPPCFSPLRRAGVHARRTLAISKIGASRRRGVRRDEGIPPYVSPDSRGRPGWPKTQNLFVGAGFTAPAGAFRRPTAAQRRLLGRRSRPRDLAATRGSRDDASIVPYMGLRLPVGRAFAAVRRGGIYPARGTLRRRGVPGTMRASSPTGVCVTRSAADLPPNSIPHS